MKKDAGFSPCRTWRYWLSRQWDESLPPLVVVGLNPSTADECVDDPTIRRCIGFARAWEHGALLMLNLFGLRSTDPKALRSAADPVGPGNDRAFEVMQDDPSGRGRRVLCAWGAHPMALGRDAAVVRILEWQRCDLVCLGKTKDGYPRHPLYVRADTLTIPFTLSEKSP